MFLLVRAVYSFFIVEHPQPSLKIVNGYNYKKKLEESTEPQTNNLVSTMSRWNTGSVDECMKIFKHIIKKWSIL